MSALAPAVGPTVEAVTIPRSVVQSVVLHNVSWETYQSLRQEEANDHVRMIYDCGALELMSPLRKHGKIATILGLMIYEWTRYRRIEIESGGNLTYQSEELKKGLEPDLCYWIANQPAVYGKDEFDPQFDPPPDLALEVDVTRSSIPKLPIYAALRIPEVWCWRKGLEILNLHADQYVRVAESSALPGFPSKLAEEFIQQRNTLGENALMEQFERAIQGHLKE